MKKIIMGMAVFMVCSMLGALVFAEMPGPDPEALWKYITEESPYQNWSFWPDHQGMQAGNAPHGPYHKVFVNDKALNSQMAPVQDGSIEVKENYSNAQELVAITVMYKVSGFNPNAGDWFWAKYSPDGKAGPAGKVEGCIACHGSRAANDYILVHEFK